MGFELKYACLASQSNRVLALACALVGAKALFSRLLPVPYGLELWIMPNLCLWIFLSPMTTSLRFKV